MVTRRKFLVGSAAGLGALLMSRTAYGSVPDISLYTDNGEEKKLHGFFGAPRLLSFWATWCKPCIDEIPVLNSLNDDISVLGLLFVSTPSDLETEIGKLRAIVEKHPIQFANYAVYAPDVHRYARAVMPEMENSVPAFSLLDRQGNHVHGQMGGLTYKDHLPQLKKVIARVK